MARAAYHRLIQRDLRSALDDYEAEGAATTTHDSHEHSQHPPAQFHPSARQATGASRGNLLQPTIPNTQVVEVVLNYQVELIDPDWIGTLKRSAQDYAKAKGRCGFQMGFFKTTRSGRAKSGQEKHLSFDTIRYRWSRLQSIQIRQVFRPCAGFLVGNEIF